MKKQDFRLDLYLGLLKRPWMTYCKTIGKNPSNILQDFIKKQLEENLVKTGDEIKVFVQTKESANGEKKQRFEILLTPSEKAALAVRAEQEGCTQRNWVIAAIRAGLTKQAQYSIKEMVVLGESNYQLLAIGRNINQIAKAMNEGDRSKDIGKLIAKLKQEIDVHTEVVSRALRASAERWDME